jgi:hypothetical protein
MTAPHIEDRDELVAVRRAAGRRREGQLLVLLILVLAAGGATGLAQTITVSFAAATALLTALG